MEPIETSGPSDDQVEKLAQQGMSNREIADLFGMSDCEIGTKFRDILRRGRANINRSLRVTQLEKAIKHKDTSMLIHLGKHMLGQVERKQLEHSGDIAFNVQWFGSEEPGGDDDADSDS